MTSLLALVGHLSDGRGWHKASTGLEGGHGGSETRAGLAVGGLGRAEAGVGAHGRALGFVAGRGSEARVSCWALHAEIKKLERLEDCGFVNA